MSGGQFLGGAVAILAEKPRRSNCRPLLFCLSFDKQPSPPSVRGWSPDAVVLCVARARAVVAKARPVIESALAAGGSQQLTESGVARQRRLKAKAMTSHRSPKGKARRTLTAKRPRRFWQSSGNPRPMRWRKVLLLNELRPMARGQRIRQQTSQLFLVTRFSGSKPATIREPHECGHYELIATTTRHIRSKVLARRTA